MIKLITKLNQITEQVLANIDETTFEQLEQFIAERDDLVKSLQATFNHSQVTTEMQQTIREILEHDKTIITRMEALRDEATQSMHKIAQGKSQKDVYDSPYTMDAIYFDKKK